MCIGSQLETLVRLTLESCVERCLWILSGHSQWKSVLKLKMLLTFIGYLEGAWNFAPLGYILPFVRTSSEADSTLPLFSEGFRS